ncbi:FAD-binding oxidoreductase [Nocardioides marmoribigeumensis]|uniref:Delta(24)-sterol reductase n=1 Tax=Nocardioides marmoribigeumensis TaxID=433649 RepID=A0ABU2BQ76_9ACTN|nr:FAD-binding oxidoreductase [Nocardioides marmoribigeumensis]MDR7360777.1 FAD/FMN-containing dehydrogenase [Nocardioides marmoribigeumensis]
MRWRNTRTAATEVGWTGHEAGVDRLRASYAAIPAGAPVRLAKPTSNLFRSRAGTDAPGLDVSGLAGVVVVAPETRTADVQGMCTYETLVDATLPHGLIPLVVPQLRSITLGGAVTGLGIESTSFRNGLPHESVLEMDVLTGDGSITTVKPGEPLFDAFPNSYGSLGYATRLRIELEEVQPYVALRHLRFGDLEELSAVIEQVAGSREWDGERVDGLDGVAFSPTEGVLTLARWTDEPGPTSDYTGQEIYYRSLQERDTDRLTTYDYLWRWDTDWFWCSGAFGLHDPRVRRVWPRRWRRSDVYHRLVGLDQRLGIVARQDRRKGIARERVIQDVEVPVDRTGEFVRWFDEAVGMRPVWLCPLRLREHPETGARTWPCYPLTPGTTYVNAGFWGTVEVPPGTPDGTLNREVERIVTELGGHKSLYSDAYYDEATFASLYNTPHLDEIRRTTDPEGRLTPLYDKAVRRR